MLRTPGRITLFKMAVLSLEVPPLAWPECGVRAVKNTPEFIVVVSFCFSIGGSREGGKARGKMKEGQKQNVNASPQQGDLGLLGPPAGQGAGGGTRARDKRVPADLRADSLATVPPTPTEVGNVEVGL
ncbi:hypothetical protein PoB_000244600 [Plakobranchus ocellatus]|uniref:Uncharacterized protein n=1 Tax=Plakobranchus ocellatus TaxID=259542 RepID=A0AAV3Y0T6_9GAST|nr:hypothetical protein PoB_000244600 [Plakobranchus ocellatus]